MRLGARLVGAVLASLLLLPAGAAWASGQRTLPDHDLVPAQRVPPKQWSHDVCTAVTAQASQGKKASKAFQSQNKRTSNVSEAKDNLVNFLGNQVQEADATLAQIRAAGVPKMKSGDKLARDIEAGFTDIRDLFAREQENATQLTTTDPAAFFTSVKDIGNRTTKSGDRLASALTKAETKYKSPTLKDPVCHS